MDDILKIVEAESILLTQHGPRKKEGGKGSKGDEGGEGNRDEDEKEEAPAPAQAPAPSQAPASAQAEASVDGKKAGPFYELRMDLHKFRSVSFGDLYTSIADTAKVSVQILSKMCQKSNETANYDPDIQGMQQIRVVLCFAILNTSNPI